MLFIFAALLVGGIGGLVSARIYAPMLARCRITKWIDEFALASRQVLVESPAAVFVVVISLLQHLLTIGDIWSLGAAFSMPLSVVDAAVLFTLMVAIAIMPISVSDWGLRELAVTAFLSAHGVPSQRALLFSICFGMTLLVAALPGAAVLIFYSPAKLGAQPAERG